LKDKFLITICCSVAMCQYCYLPEFHTTTMLVLLTARNEKFWGWDSFSVTVFMKIGQLFIVTPSGGQTHRTDDIKNLYLLIKQGKLLHLVRIIYLGVTLCDKPNLLKTHLSLNFISLKQTLLCVNKNWFLFFLPIQ
jgi:hypothetical protein